MLPNSFQMTKERRWSSIPLCYCPVPVTLSCFLSVCPFCPIQSVRHEMVVTRPTLSHVSE